jgi:hypothetical protein
MGLTPQDVEERIAEAARVVRMLPAEGHKPYRSAMPEPVRDRSDQLMAYGYNVTEVRIQATAQQIDRLDEVLGWVYEWLSTPERICVWAFAQGVRAGRVARKLHCNRSTVWRMRRRAYKLIAGRVE